MSLWAVLAATLVLQLLITSTASGIPQHLQEELRQHSKRIRKPAAQVTIWTFSALALPLAWTWHSVEVHDWRYSAIAWLPVLAAGARKVMQPPRVEPAQHTPRLGADA